MRRPQGWLYSRSVSTRRITLEDLARHLGLDKSSISLALRGSRHVSDATRQRVHEAAVHLGYTPNLAARQLASTRSNVVGLVMPAQFEPLAYAVVVRTLRSLAAAAAARGQVFTVFSAQDLAGLAAGHTHLPLLADGFLVWGEIAAQQVLEFQKLRRPLVVLDPSHPSYASYSGPVAAIDNRGGGDLVARQLLAAGARRLLVLHVSPGHRGHQLRWEGARAAWLNARPLASLTYCQPAELSDAELRRFCGLRKPAVFCTNDHGAMQLWHRLLGLGLTVPADVKLAGFDGEPYGDLVGLTTAVFDAERLGQEAMALLLALIAGTKPPPPNVTVPVTLRPGRTA